jgi:hypothetical protein
VTPPNGEQPTAPPPKVAPADQAKVKFPDLRVRGKVTDLTIPQSSAADFKGTTPATVSFSSDGVAKKSTAAMAGYVGYVVFDVNGVSPNGRTPGTEFEGILYTGVNRNVVTTGTGKTEKTTASDTVDPGALFSVTSHGDSVWNIFNVRPDLLFDVVNDSTLASVNFQWVPVVKSTLNVFHSGEAWGLPIAGKIVLDARADFGTYPDRGSAAVASTNRDYDRFGGQAGIVLVSENDNVPITLSSTYTGMYGATGGVNVGDFVNALTLYLDSDKNVGVSASYANGVREDTGKRENTWLVGLSIHY